MQDYDTDVFFCLTTCSYYDDEKEIWLDRCECEYLLNEITDYEFDLDTWSDEELLKLCEQFEDDMGMLYKPY